MLKHDFIREKWRNQCLEVFFDLTICCFPPLNPSFLCEMLIALGFLGMIIYITQSRLLTIILERQIELPMTMKFGESFEKFALELFKGDNLVAMKFRFYLIWIYLYLVVCKSVIISNSYLSLVILFFKHDKPLALAPMFLEIIFNNFHDVIDENLSGSIGSPL